MKILKSHENYNEKQAEQERKEKQDELENMIWENNDLGNMYKILVKKDHPTLFITPPTLDRPGYVLSGYIIHIARKLLWHKPIFKKRVNIG